MEQPIEKTVIDEAEEDFLLQQLEVAKSQHVEFPPETERIYVKLLWRKRLRERKQDIFDMDQVIRNFIKKTKKREQIVKKK